MNSTRVPGRASGITQEGCAGKSFPLPLRSERRARYPGRSESSSGGSAMRWTSRTSGWRELALSLAVLAASCASPRPAPSEREPARPLHTVSIVARDPETGELGVAVQSHWFSVGAVVSWAEAGVGAVATQSFVNPAYGPDGLARMKQGKPAADALAELVAQDPGEAVRQVAFVDAAGRVAAHTGKNCIASAAHHVGAGYSVQANRMENDRVVPAMARAFEGTKGPLAERLLAALAAAQREGGDIRGQQSAALLVVRAKSTGKIWEDRLVDLRVEDHARP